MTLEKFVNTCRICGRLSDKVYYRLINEAKDIYNKYRNLELRKSEIEFLNRFMTYKDNYDLGNVIYALREDLRSFYKIEEDYDKLLYYILELNKNYKDSRYENVIVNNVVNNSDVFIKLNKKNLEFFKFCDTIYDIEFHINGNIYKPDMIYSEDDSEVRSFGLMDIWGDTLGDDIALLVIDKDKKVKAYSSLSLDTKEKLVYMMKEEIEKGLTLGVIASIDDGVELFNRMDLIE